MRRSPVEPDIEPPTAKPKRAPTEQSGPTPVTKPVERPPVPTPAASAKPVTPNQAIQRPPRRPTQQPRAQSAAGNEIHRLIADLNTQLDRGVDHFALLGTPFDAPEDIVRSAYFALARKLHPDRLAALGVDDVKRDAQRLFAQINAAFAVLSDPVKRDEYIKLVKRGGEAAVRADDKKAEELAARVMQAEEAFRMGEMALRRDQLAQAVAAFTTAVDLQPHESEYQALLAWAKFASASDKNALASATRTALQRAIDANAKSPTARFFLGRVERMLGKEKEALGHFQEVLRIKPGHAEAASEARLLEQRLRGKR
jgi:curved DNA-binding protein CbpA